MKHVIVKVANGSGSPQNYAKVSIHVSQFAASGKVPDKHTDNNGEAHFSLDIDDSAQITVYVNGSEKVPQEPVRSEYLITI